MWYIKIKIEIQRHKHNLKRLTLIENSGQVGGIELCELKHLI